MRIGEPRQTRRAPGWHRDWVRALILIVVPSALAIGFNSLRDDSLPLVAATDYRDEILVPCPENVIEAESVELADLPNDLAGYVVVDARSRGEYFASHLPNALSIPHRTLRGNEAEYQQNLAADLAPLDGAAGLPILVCGDARLGSGRDLASVLRERGFLNVRYLDGGCTAWEDAGRPVERTLPPVLAVPVSELSDDLDGLTIVDARFSRYFRRGHLPGARSIAYMMLEGADDERLAPLRQIPGEQILLYGSDARNEGLDLARLMTAGGWSGVRYLEGGFEAWEAAGRAVETDDPGAPVTADGNGSGIGAGGR